mgnify:CR=1 FL=1
MNSLKKRQKEMLHASLKKLLNDPLAPLRRESTDNIVATINTLLQILNERGDSAAIVNWDERGKKLGLIRTIGSTHYFMQESRSEKQE